MTYRKTWFDYVLWAVYAGFCVTMLAYTGNRMYAFYVGDALAGLGAFLLFCVFIRGSGFPVRQCGKNTSFPPIL